MSEISHDFDYRSDRSQSSTLSQPGLWLNKPDVQTSFQKEVDELKDWRFTINDDKSKEYHNIQQELYDSERTYLVYLLIVQKLFINPLAHHPRVIKKSDLRSLFGEISSIYNVNKELLCRLRTEVSVGEAFKQLTPFMKFYTTYAGNYTNSQTVYNKLMLRGGFREFIDEQEKNPLCQGIKFQALLIMPIQRIPRYILLLRRLLDESNSPKENLELENVISGMNEVTDLIESCIRDFENDAKLHEIQDSLGLKEDIVGPGRRVIKEGALFKRTHCGESTYSERQFWLLNDILVYGKRRMGMGPKYECSCIFPLRHCVLDYNQIDGSLNVKCKTHSILVTSDNYDTLKSWFDEISTAIQRLKLLRSTLRKESSRQQVKEFKSQIKKKFTKKFINTTYLYDVTSSIRPKKHNRKNWDEASCSRDVNVMISPLNPIANKAEFAPTRFIGWSSNRKRRAQSDFDVELRQALEKRKEEGKIYLTETYNKAQLESHAPTVDTAYENCEQTIDTNVRLANCEATVAVNQDSLDVEQVEGFDECDRVPRTRGAARNNIKLRSQNTLSRPQIRKYSYQEHCNVEEPSVPSTADSSFHENDSSTRFTARPVPWWVSESTPATYANSKQRKGFLSAVKSSCSIM